MVTYTTPPKVYRIHVPSIGTIHKLEDNIAAARQWARRAFPREAVTVSRAFTPCPACGSRPCECREGLR